MKPWLVFTTLSYIVCLGFFLLVLEDILDKYLSKAKITQVNQLSFEEMELPLMVFCPLQGYKGPMNNEYHDEKYAKNIFTLQDLFAEKTLDMLKSGYNTYTVPSLLYGSCQAIQKQIAVRAPDFDNNFILNEKMDLMIYFLGKAFVFIFCLYCWYLLPFKININASSS